jgi:hypothetical protein
MKFANDDYKWTFISDRDDGKQNAEAASFLTFIPSWEQEAAMALTMDSDVGAVAVHTEVFTLLFWLVRKNIAVFLHHLLGSISNT